MPSGTVKWFRKERSQDKKYGYGFIAPDQSDDNPGSADEPDVFVHISAVKDSGLDDLQQDQKVSYELEKGQNGKMSAVNIKLIDS